MKFLAILAVLLGSSAIAQECVIPAESLVGKLDKSGRCIGLAKDFVLKYSLGSAECPPTPRSGHLLLGNCVADATPPPIQATDDVESRLKRLEVEVGELRIDLQRERDEAYVRYQEIMSEFDFMKSGSSSKNNR